MKLSDRLEMIASFVEPGNRLADIGTDHGYVPIYLVQTGRVPSALAMDVRKGPLLRAEEHIREAGLSGRIQTRLSDGLKKLAPGVKAYLTKLPRWFLKSRGFPRFIWMKWGILSGR